MAQEVDNAKVFFAGIAVIVGTFIMIMVTAFHNPAVDQTYENIGKTQTPTDVEQVAGK